MVISIDIICTISNINWYFIILCKYKINYKYIYIFDTKIGYQDVNYKWRRLLANNDNANKQPNGQGNTDGNKAAATKPDGKTGAKTGPNAVKLYNTVNVGIYYLYTI